MHENLEQYYNFDKWVLIKNITRYEQYYNLSLVSYEFLILNLSLTITLIKLGTFFASKSQGGEFSPPPPPVSAPES